MIWNLESRHCARLGRVTPIAHAKRAVCGVKVLQHAESGCGVPDDQVGIGRYPATAAIADVRGMVGGSSSRRSPRLACISGQSVYSVAVATPT